MNLEREDSPRNHDRSASHRTSPLSGRPLSIVELVDALELEKSSGNTGQIANKLLHMGLVILDEPGSLRFSKLGRTLLFHLLAKLYEITSVVITTNLRLRFGEWASVFGGAKMTTVPLDGWMHRCHIPETRDDSSRFKNNSEKPQPKKENIKHISRL